MMKLENEITIVIPQSDNQGNPINHQLVNQLITEATREVGGNTVREVKGQWYSDIQNTLITDHNKEVTFNFSTLTENTISHLDNLIQHLLTKEDQEAVAVKLNGTMYLFEQDDAYHLEDIL